MKLTIKHAIGFAFLFSLIFGALETAVAQQQKKRVIQLSGVVLEEDSAANNSRPLAGVHVYVPKAGRGTTTNGMGFFSMPVLENDEIVVSSVGFQKQHFTVPAGSPEYQTIVVTMVMDTTYLQEIVIIPFPTEEVFKQAVLALNMPVDDNGVDKRNFNQELMALMVKTAPMDGYQNQRYYLDQWAGSANNRFQPVTNPFLNPFNWAKFFSSLKKDKKKK
ncbi:carboxypeptidase-like regulatory domain-containing protein [Chryseolinea lacunae]|uniref:Carboxypeptidase-like regulatory domain-containing protein n=1 Tax=Chryseolinea lacunae TaxID=2801331 RepID=A0ABS1KLL8_9BACT|nr:carboxypeptidase-like regulatory domain-containing protein [Chryseolinea lacunae]